MILFPRPRVPYVIALLLALPTYGAALAVFYFLFKRPYDKAAVNAIFAAAKLSMQSRKVRTVFKVNRGAIQRVFAKFSDPAAALKYGIGVPFIDWGVLRHPLLNAGMPFTVRVDRQGDTLHVEASPGEAWWLLTDRVWLGRRGTAPGLPTGLSIKADAGDEDRLSDDPQDAAVALLLWTLASEGEPTELPSLTYEQISDFASRHELGAEWYPDYQGMRFWVCINKREYRVDVTNLDPSKGDDGRVRVSARALTPAANRGPDAASFEEHGQDSSPT